MHHAYVYEGSQELLGALVESAQRLFGLVAEHNPDVRVQSIEKFGIDDAAALKASAAFKTMSGRALFIVGMASITTEAQQALLKLFEEPQTGVSFVLLVPHGSLLPTLRSRLLDYPEALATTIDQSSVVSSFLKGDRKSRGATIAALLKDDEGVRERVRDFLQSLELALYTKLSSGRNTDQLRSALEDIAATRSYLSDRSPSLKMLLEHVALSVPRL